MNNLLRKTCTSFSTNSKLKRGLATFITSGKKIPKNELPTMFQSNFYE